MSKRGPGISGAALAFIGAGAWLAYAGLVDVPIIDGLRQLLKGEVPSGSATKLDLLSTARVGSATGLGLSNAPAVGKIVTVPGTSIKVDSSIAGSVASMVAAAKADGVTLNGGGYRTSLEQAATRAKNHCTCSDRSDCCSPPTAPVGKSQHEVGLAIDFSNCSTRSTTVYKWLAAHAGKYGLKNLPSEPWHWSTTGK